jgi:hypothetical protein
MKHWRIDEVGWDRFDRSRIDPEIVAIVKAAAMVERNGTDYGTYLNRVFHDDPAFCAAADNWSVEPSRVTGPATSCRCWRPIIPCAARVPAS